MPSATNQQMQRIVEVCEKSEIKFRTLPTMQDLGNRATRIGVLKREHLREFRSETELNLMRAVRDSLDPGHILNPGKVL